LGPEDVGKCFDGIGNDEVGSYYSTFIIREVSSERILVQDKMDWTKENTVVMDGYTIDEIDKKLVPYGFQIVPIVGNYEGEIHTLPGKIEGWNIDLGEQIE